MRMTVLALSALLVGEGAAAAAEAGDPVVTLTLKDHRFTPPSVTVPAGRTVRIELINHDSASEEFDSADLRVEQDVTPHGRASFTVGPLEPGTYSFMGELHSETAQGQLVAVAAPRP